MDSPLHRHETSFGETVSTRARNVPFIRGGRGRERCTVCRIIGFEIVGGINIVGSAKNNWKNVQVFRCWTQGSGKGEGVDRIVEMK